MYPDHASNNEAAEIQRGCCCCGHQELAHGAGHRWIIYSTHWCSQLMFSCLSKERMWSVISMPALKTLLLSFRSSPRWPPQEEESPDVQAPDPRDVSLPGLQCVHNRHLSRGQSMLNVEGHTWPVWVFNSVQLSCWVSLFPLAERL